MTTVKHYAKKFARYLRHTRAVSALEYAILVGAIAVAVVAAVMNFADDIETAMNKIGGKIADTKMDKVGKIE